MYLPMQIPKLRPDLALRLQPLCRQLRMPMEEFMNEAVAQALARAEEGLKQQEQERPGPA